MEEGPRLGFGEPALIAAGWIPSIIDHPSRASMLLWPVQP